jgi:hypothetical protein
MNDAEHAVFILVIGLKIGVFLAVAVVSYLSRKVRHYGSSIPTFIMLIGLCLALEAGLQLMGDLSDAGIGPMVLGIDQVRMLTDVLLGISAFLTMVVGYDFSHYLTPLLLNNASVSELKRGRQSERASRSAEADL